MSDQAYVVDASVFASFFVVNDVNSEKARQCVIRLLERGYRLSAPSAILLEVASAMRRQKIDVPRVTKALEWIRSRVELVAFDKIEDDALMKIVLENDLRTMDAIYVALATLTKRDLLTFDKEQARKSATVTKSIDTIE
jgi:predicted nucleic acid-binding protein